MSFRRLGVLPAIAFLCFSFFLGFQVHQTSINSLQSNSGTWHGKFTSQYNGQDIMNDVSLFITKEEQRISVSSELIGSPELGNFIYDARIKVLENDSGRVHLKLVDRELFGLDKFEKRSQLAPPAMSGLLTLEAWKLEDKDTLLVDVRYNSETSLTMILRR
ncbi:hypothetical protein L4C54_19110 [Vibrio lamellibrachiae]|uniref:hypothetical protein n=1 Tax=Vibrio lamellibrachiae TaxID=2910253 RepID=UPI003D0E4120